MCGRSVPALQKGDGWTESELRFLRENFYSMTNRQLVDAINLQRKPSGRLSVGAVRGRCGVLGLSRGIQIRWSDEDISKLRAWYPLIGDKEIASYLNDTATTFRTINGARVYRVFTKKHVEKKRRLLGWSRTREQLDRVRADNLLINTPEALRKMWETRGVFEDGTIRVWKGVRFIKINGKYVPYTRWFYRNYIGELGPGDVVYHKDGDRLNDTPGNLVVIDHKDLGAINSKYRDPPELREAKRALKLLIKTINEYEKQD